MRKFKNTILFILALLPAVSLIFTLGFAIGGNFTTPEEIIPDIVTSPCYIAKNSNGLYTVESFDLFTIMDNALLRSSGCVAFSLGGEQIDGFLNQKLVLGTLYLIQESEVCIITTPMVFMGYYFVYMFVLVMVDVIFNLVTFVPRKCSEFLVGGYKV